MRVLSLLLLLTLGCQNSHRLVIHKDADRDMIVRSLTTLNIRSECGYYPTVAKDDGKRRDWTRKYPTFGTTTIQYVDPKHPKLQDSNQLCAKGNAYYPNSYNRCRIYIDRTRANERSIAHELLHCQGFKHVPGPSLMDERATSWALPAEVRCY